MKFAEYCVATGQSSWLVLSQAYYWKWKSRPLPRTIDQMVLDYRQRNKLPDYTQDFIDEKIGQKNFDFDSLPQLEG